MTELAERHSTCVTTQEHAALDAEQAACLDELLSAMTESEFYGDYLPMETAPRDSTWIEMRFRCWSDPLHRPASKYGRSSGRGDAPDIWRFENRGCLRFADERGWQWRPISDRTVVDRLVAADGQKTPAT